MRKDLNSILLAGEVLTVNERENTDEYFEFTMESLENNGTNVVKVYTRMKHSIENLMMDNPVGAYVRVVGKLEALMGRSIFINAEHVEIVKRSK